jgi:hypothetical protein
LEDLGGFGNGQRNVGATGADPVGKLVEFGVDRGNAAASVVVDQLNPEHRLKLSW